MDKDANTCTFYVDGSVHHSSTYAQYGHDFDPVIGGRSGAYYHDGPIDEIRIYNKALSSSEVTDLQTSITIPDGSSLPKSTDPLTVAGWYKKTAPFTDHFDTTKMTGSTIAPQTTGANAYPNTGDLSISPIWTITSGGTSNNHVVSTKSINTDRGGGCIESYKSDRTSTGGSGSIGMYHGMIKAGNTAVYSSITSGD